MKALLSDVKEMKSGKIIAGTIGLALALSYGYLMIHTTIGIDDTCIERYFVEGWAPHVGRWTLYLLNLVFDFAHFTPFFMEAVGVILLGVSAYLFCVLWYRISEKRVSGLVLISFAAIYVTFPLAGEVYMYYLHNGVSLAFCLLAISGLLWWDYVKQKRMSSIIWITVLLSLAVGCYESFALVYIVLICAINIWSLLHESTIETRKIQRVKELVMAVVPLIGAVVIRTVAYSLINAFTGIPADARDMSKLQLWILNNPFIILKDLLHQFVVRYMVNGIYIFGILVYVTVAVLFVAIILVVAIKKKKWKLLFWGCLIMVAPWMLIIVELVVTPYRATQALMLFVAFAVLFCYEVISRIDLQRFNKSVSVILAILLFVVVFRQGFELHQFFCFDSLKDEYSRDYCKELAYELYHNYDTTNKPVVFIGQRQLPETLQEQVYRDVEDVILVHYNYVDEAGYRIWDVACQDTLAWTAWADLGDGEYEIYPYMKMMGYDFVQPTVEQREKLLKEAIQNPGYPVWPKEGSVVESEDVICVYLGPVNVEL